MPPRTLFLLIAAAIGFSPILMGCARAAEPGAAPTADKLRGMIDQLITDEVRHSLPETYEDNRQWNKTHDVIDGVKVSAQNGQLKTHSRTRQVNHGTWRRYQATLIDPGEKFHIEIGPMSTLSDGRTAFDVVGTARVHVTGQLAQWELGLQLASFKVEADATVRVRLSLVVGLDFEGAALVLKPEATAADLTLTEFRLTRVGKLGSPLVKELNGGARDMVEHFIARKRQKLVDSVNRQIAKSKDKLRISLGDVVLSKIPSLQSLFGGGDASDAMRRSGGAEATKATSGAKQ